MIAFPRASIHQPPGATNVAPSGVLRGVSDASFSPAGAVAATFASAALAGRLEMQKRINNSEMIHRVSIPKNLTIQEYPGKPFSAYHRAKKFDEVSLTPRFIGVYANRTEPQPFQRFQSPSA
jgi:hypothetical protein